MGTHLAIEVLLINFASEGLQQSRLPMSRRCQNEGTSPRQKLGRNRIKDTESLCWRLATSYTACTTSQVADKLVRDRVHIETTIWNINRVGHMIQ